MKKIVTIIGARPQFIKAAIFSKSILQSNLFKEVIIHTGQHYDQDMSDVFFDQMKIPVPKYNLNIAAKLHGEMTGLQIIEIEKCLLQEKPDYVLVYGDTNSTLAGAIAAVKLEIPIIHIESGLRSFNNSMPEEINRIITDRVSKYLFVPTSNAVQNLLSEGVNPDKIFLVGDIMLDATLYFKNFAQKPLWFDSIFSTPSNFILCTIHRAENTDNPVALNSIFRALSKCVVPIILPLHPRTKSKLLEFDIYVAPNIHLVAPVGYFDMLWLENNSSFIITDSGGLQKEAYFHNKYCITLRKETEWNELVDSNFNILVGFDEDKILNALHSVIPKVDTKMLYGDGNACSKILNILKETL
ncbi:non-hydrolyzing UDP-N-acetylglucosamine 2-epimerase [Aquirufa antheringensis]|uniref:non-hydrolyzing UDP-N-acetylglucosamine 2-epimerase n=1 Tax=Aquirufa antheringensis TaxID=2516559 RepID=UPI0022A94537|nr:UDP-N-acetylglucosamine 2-epimerase (non-hydrolyzing) [Aquirufa antheringensis]MCZ2490066.1 UDP-N-acetylglucosamine 2-epimerase (non-hydrolyzing) [Aquirufa antheringensis]